MKSREQKRTLAERRGRAAARDRRSLRVLTRTARAFFDAMRKLPPLTSGDFP